MRAVATHNPHLVLLDLGLPDIDGLTVLAKLREWTEIPVIVLSARGQEQDKISALEGGADDYVTKPFGVGELIARMRVALRNALRANEGTEVTSLEFGSLNINFTTRQVWRDSVELHLTPIEYQLLTLLTKNEGKVLTHKYLLEQVWGAAFNRQNHYLRVYMGQLRHKIEVDPSRPKFITTEPGVGYRFRVPIV